MKLTASGDQEATTSGEQPEIEFSSTLDGMQLLQTSESDSSSVDNVYQQLLGRIIRGELVANVALTSTQLAEELGVSRTPVVSAIDRLVSDGILTKEKNRRATVHLEAKDWLLQVNQLREIIEPPAAGLAAKHITPEALRQVEMLANNVEMAKEEDWIETAHKFDYGLHISIADHSSNALLRKTIHKCWSYNLMSYGIQSCTDPEVEMMYYREHLAILSALQRGDSKTASIAMSFHLRSMLNYSADTGTA